jgi:hypothetical protein
VIAEPTRTSPNDATGQGETPASSIQRIISGNKVRQNKSEWLAHSTAPVTLCARCIM